LTIDNESVELTASCAPAVSFPVSLTLFTPSYQIKGDWLHWCLSPFLLLRDYKPTIPDSETLSSAAPLSIDPSVFIVNCQSSIVN